MATSKKTEKSKSRSRTPKGNVSIEGVGGRLRLCIPAIRSIAGNRERIPLRLKDTPENRAKGKIIEAIINSHIENETYDRSKLDDYIAEGLGKSGPSKTTSSPKTPLQLDELWKEFYAYKEEFVEQTTLENDYDRTTSAISKLSTKLLTEQSAKQINSELRAQETEEGYLRILTYISACCKWAVAKGKIQENLFENYYKKAYRDSKRNSSGDDPPDPFNRKGMERVIAAYEQHPYYSYLANYIKFRFYTGARIEEATGLIWENVNFETKRILFCNRITFSRGKHKYLKGTKTEAFREFPFDNYPELEKFLKDMHSSTNPKPEDFVFRDPEDGGYIKYPKLLNSWYGQSTRQPKSDEKKYLPQGIVSKLARLGEKNGGIDHYRSPNQARHTFFTQAINALEQVNKATFANVAQLAEYSGNSVKEILDSYLGRSGDTSIVNIFGSDPDKLLSSAKDAPSIDYVKELELEVTVLKQENQVLKIRLEEARRNQSLAVAAAPVTDTIAVATLPAQSLTPAKSESSFQMKPSEAQVEQLTLFLDLAERVAQQ